MTKAEHRKRIVDVISVLATDPYIWDAYLSQLNELLSVVEDMHNRRMNPRRPDWARPATPQLRAQLWHVYHTTNLAVDQIAQLYGTNQAHVSEAVNGVRK